MQINEEIVYAGELSAEQLDQRNRELREMLYGGVYDITFTKVNG